MATASKLIQAQAQGWSSLTVDNKIIVPVPTKDGVMDGHSDVVYTDADGNTPQEIATRTVKAVFICAGKPALNVSHTEDSLTDVHKRAAVTTETANSLVAHLRSAPDKQALADTVTVSGL